jgi:hypothetical protein
MWLDTSIFLRQALQIAPQLVQNLVIQTNTGRIQSQVVGLHALINVFSRNLKAECSVSLLEAISDIFTDSTGY